VTVPNVPDFNAISKSGPVRPVVAVYGGAFDPIHYGHLGCIEALLDGRRITRGSETHIIDQVWVIPTEDHRRDKLCICPQTIRLHLCKLAIQELKLHTRGVGVDTIPPADRQESGTMALLDRLSLQFPKVQFFPVIGSELISSLPTWRQSSRLSREVTFIVIQRSGITETPVTESPGVQFGFQTFDPIACSLPPYSSSSIRELLAKGRCSAEELSHYVPASVAKYILANQLYKEPLS
jgi:nicotinate (nicotinamide) nucleotide adenylyltransferase